MTSLDTLIAERKEEWLRSSGITFLDFDAETARAAYKLALEQERKAVCDCCGWDDSGYTHEPQCSSLAAESTPKTD